MITSISSVCLLVLLVSQVSCMIKDMRPQKYSIELPKELYDEKYIYSLYKEEEKALILYKEAQKQSLDKYNTGDAKYGRNIMHQYYTPATNYTRRMYDLSQVAYRVCEKIINSYGIPRDKAYQYLSQISIPKEYCPYQSEHKCDKYSKYRTYDGTCNNHKYPHYGSKYMPLKRLELPEYHDWMSHPKYMSHGGYELPNPRYVGMMNAYPMDYEVNLNMLTIGFGQFMDHDLAFTNVVSGSDGRPIPCSCDDKSNADCVNIDTPAGDPWQNDQKCIVTPRSAAVYATPDCKMSMREQVNEYSSILDLSQIYGLSKEDNAKMRSYKDGKLRVSKIAGQYKDQLPIAEPGSGACTSESKGYPCFFTIESRSNQQVGLAAFHWLFTLEHNFMCDELKVINPHWDDERLHQEARKILIGMYQNMIYQDWLEIVCGPDIQELYGLKPVEQGKPDYFMDYDYETKPFISNDFTTAAMRFGHSLVSHYILKADKYLRPIKKIKLVDSFFQTDEAYLDSGLEGVIRGLVVHKALASDTHLSYPLQDRLFEDMDPKAETHHFSLSALNLKRGREHGLKNYLTYRKMAGLPDVKHWSDLSNMRPECVKQLQATYKTVEDVELWIGGLCEINVKDGVVGPTFAHIIAKQFRDLKYGDSHFYEAGHNAYTRFTIDQVNELRKADIAKMICRHTDAQIIFDNEWFLESKVNPIKNCTDLDGVDLTKWKEAPLYYP